MANRLISALIALAAVPALAPPAMAQSYQEQQRWDAAQRRYQAETSLYNQARDRYYAARSRDQRGGGYGQPGYPPPPGYAQPGGYPPPPPPPPPGAYAGGGYDDPYATDYDASRYYRDDPRYQERRLSSNDEVYRGSDGRYYCKRSDGTTGLIIGAVGGGVLGNVLDGGRHRAAGTLVGGALGALLGKSIDQNNSDIRCR